MKFTGERVVPTDMRKNVDTYQQHLIRYVWALSSVVNKTVLDSACGTGYGTNMLSYVTNHIEGIDISEDAIVYAKENYPDITFVIQDLDKLVLPYSFDVIVSFETIEHLKNPVKFMKTAKKHCKKFIGSIPVNCPTEYHLHTWNALDIFKMVVNIFPYAEFYYQKDFVIEKGFDCGAKDGMILFESEIK